MVSRTQHIHGLSPRSDLPSITVKTDPHRYLLPRVITVGSQVATGFDLVESSLCRGIYLELESVDVVISNN